MIPHFILLMYAWVYSQCSNKLFKSQLLHGAVLHLLPDQLLVDPVQLDQLRVRPPLHHLPVLHHLDLNKCDEFNKKAEEKDIFIITRISWALRTVESLWAITKMVRPSMILSNASETTWTFRFRDQSCSRNGHLFVLSIEGGGGLVQNQDLWVANCCSSYRKSLSLTSWQLIADDV